MRRVGLALVLVAAAALGSSPVLRALPSGVQLAWAQEDGQDSSAAADTAVNSPPPDAAPLSGAFNPHVVPGVIQAEDYDPGGRGGGSAIISAGFDGRPYRPDDTHIKVVPDGSTVVGWFQGGEWLQYTVDAAATGLYDITVRLGSADSPDRTLIVAVDGLVSGEIVAPHIASWDSPLQLATLTGLNLTAGVHRLRLTAGPLDWVDIDQMELKLSAGDGAEAAAAADASGPANPAAPPDTATLPPDSSALTSAACYTRLQARVDAAAPGATVRVPKCLYRETVRIAKPLTLDGQGSAEIRGSDVWTGWRQSGSTWLMGPAPVLANDGDSSHCEPNTGDRCMHAEQIFVDGKPLAWVAANPRSGEFALDGERNIILADNPSGHTVEVTTRARWVDVEADNVIIQGFTMRHAGSAPNIATALGNQYHNNFIVRDSTLSDAHGSIVSIDGGSGSQILNNDISRGGQLGVSGWNASHALVQGNKIHDNANDGFSADWAAGGLKMISMADLTLDSNEVWNNAGPGLWCDISCSNITVSNNRAHDNNGPGVFFEVSVGAEITGNAVWSTRGSAPGILISSSASANVHDNVLAWNPTGISIISNDRPDRPKSGTVSNLIRDNTIIMGALDGVALEWAQWNAGQLFDPGAKNAGQANRYWYPSDENGQPRFSWQHKLTRLTDFNGTPGGSNGSYLSTATRNDILAANHIPAAS